MREFTKSSLAPQQARVQGILPHSFLTSVRWGVQSPKPCVGFPAAFGPIRHGPDNGRAARVSRPFKTSRPAGAPIDKELML